MNMSVYSYMANNKKKWRAVYRYTDFTGKRRQKNTPGSGGTAGERFQKGKGERLQSQRTEPDAQE